MTNRERARARLEAWYHKHDIWSSGDTLDDEFLDMLTGLLDEVQREAREACAKICDRVERAWIGKHDRIANGALICAEEIRRGSNGATKATPPE